MSIIIKSVITMENGQQIKSLKKKIELYTTHNKILKIL